MSDDLDYTAALTPAAHHILLALADGERHGYAIMQDISVQTGGRTRLGPGALYGTIKRLLADGLIVENAERPDRSLNEERRRYYQMTDLGRKAVAAEMRHLAEVVAVARARHVLVGPVVSPV